MTDIVDRLTGEKCDYDTRCYAASEITILRLEKQKLRAALEGIAANTYGYEPNAMSDEEAKNYFAALFFAAQGKARAALAQGGDK